VLSRASTNPDPRAGRELLRATPLAELRFEVARSCSFRDTACVGDVPHESCRTMARVFGGEGHVLGNKKKKSKNLA